MAEDITNKAANKAIDVIGLLVAIVAGVLAVTYVLGGTVMDLLGLIA